MRILQINTLYGSGSTGKIARSIAEHAKKNGHSCITAYRYREKDQSESPDSVTVSSYLDCHIHNFIARRSALVGFFSYFRTLSFIKKVKRYSPSVVHIHNLQGSYINVGLLLSYLKKNAIPTVMTLHDCWPVTGGCACLGAEGCRELSNRCKGCKGMPRDMVRLSPFSRFLSALLAGYVYRKKRKWFTGHENMTVVVPSLWMKQVVNQSFLSCYPVKVIKNGIDLSVFKPTEGDFREKHSLSGKYILLGVSSVWNKRKGLDTFAELCEYLDSDIYKIVLVGVDEKTAEILPKDILAIGHTESEKELAEIFSAADLFLNPTLADSFGLVNAEALACGTPGLCFRSGGAPECYDSLSGVCIEKCTARTLAEKIDKIRSEKAFSPDNCVKRARHFDINEKCREYSELYREISE